MVYPFRGSRKVKFKENEFIKYVSPKRFSDSKQEIRFGTIIKVYTSTFGSKRKGLALQIKPYGSDKYGRKKYTVSARRCLVISPYCLDCKKYVSFNFCNNLKHKWIDIYNKNIEIDKEANKWC